MAFSYYVFVEVCDKLVSVWSRVAFILRSLGMKLYTIERFALVSNRLNFTRARVCEKNKTCRAEAVPFDDVVV